MLFKAVSHLKALMLFGAGLGSPSFVMPFEVNVFVWPPPPPLPPPPFKGGGGGRRGLPHDALGHSTCGVFFTVASSFPFHCLGRAEGVGEGGTVV